MSNSYQVLSERIYSDFPIFGSCIRQRAAVALSKDKSPQAVKILAEAVVRSGDRKVITIALEALRNLRDRDSVNAFCQVWAESRHKDLTTILKNRRYVSTEPKFLVLSALKVGALDLVKKGDIKVLDPLLAAIGDKDTQIASAASVCLVELQDRKVIDALCKRWIENPSSQLQNAIQKGNYEPEDAISKALFYFLLGEWQKYEDLDFDQSLLTKAYQLANKQVKERVSKQAGTAGRVEFIKVLTSGKQDFDVEQMTDQDWESLSEILEAQPDRKTIWKFLYNAPPIWSKKLLDKLTQLSCKWFRKDEEVTVKTLLTLSENLKEEDFKLIPYLFMEEKYITSLMREEESNDEWNDEQVGGYPDFHKWKLYFSPDSHILFGVNSGSERHYSRGIRLWSFPDGKLLNILHDLTLVVSPDSKIVVSTGGERESNEINLWSLPSGNHIRTLKVKMPPYIEANTKGLISLVISPDGKMLASRCWSIDPKWYPDNIRTYHEETELTKRILKENTIDLWSLPSGDYIRSIPSPISSIKFESEYCHSKISREGYMVISPDSRFLVSGSGDGNIGFWNLSNGNYTQLNKPDTYDGSMADHLEAQFTPNSRILVARFSRETYIWHFLDSNHHFKSLNCDNIAISHDGCILASASNQGINLWNLPDGSLLRTLILDNEYGDYIDSVISVQISQENRTLKALIKRKFKSIYFISLDIWDLHNGNLINIMKITGYNNVQISPDGNTLVQSNKSMFCLSSLNVRHIPISKFTNRDIAKITLKVKDPAIEESFRNTLKFILALIDFRQQFDIDIEDASNNIASSEFDIEIEE